MRLKSVSLKNFRCFSEETIEFDNYTALVGANNAGKSAVLGAINIFFRSNPKSIPLTLDDFYKRLFDRTLEIRLTFSELTEEETSDFSHYARGGELTFFIEASVESGNVKSSLHGSRLANPDFAPFFSMTNATDKKNFYDTLSPKYTLPKWKSQAQGEASLREIEERETHLNSPIPSEANAFGVEGPIPRLNKYIDFVYVPAVKDASEEAVEARNTAFTRLVERAVRAKLNVDERIATIRQNAKSEIDDLSASHQKVLETLSGLIGTEYRKFNAAASEIHLEWGKFDDRSLQINLPPVRLEVSDDLIRNPIAKFGHGTQRNYIMAILLVSATYDFTSLQTLVLGCEEPELYQHPPQAKQFANALQTLTNNRTQVIITTHSPYFIAAKFFENIRVIRRTVGEKSKVYWWSIDEHCSMIASAKKEDPIATKAARAALNQFMQPQMNEIFFASGVILVEGEEDKAILSRFMQISGRQAALLGKGIEIIPVNGKGNLINAISIARGFQIPYYAIFDGDMSCAPKDMKKNVEINQTLLSLLTAKHDQDGTIGSTVFGEHFCVWKNSIQDEIDDAVAWQEAKAKTAEELGWSLDRLKKNAILLEASLDRYAKQASAKQYETLCGKIVAFFEKPESPPAIAS